MSSWGGSSLKGKVKDFPKNKKPEKRENKSGEKKLKGNKPVNSVRKIGCAGRKSRGTLARLRNFTAGRLMPKPKHDIHRERPEQHGAYHPRGKEEPQMLGWTIREKDDGVPGKRKNKTNQRGKKAETEKMAVTAAG